MIEITKNKNNIIFRGHSLPDICASVSSIMYTTVKALNSYDKECITYTDNNLFDFVNIDINKHDMVIDLLINNMFDCLYDLQSDKDVGEDKIKIQEG